MAYEVLSPPWLSELGFWQPQIDGKRHRRVHGSYHLPPGYDFAIVPSQMEISHYNTSAGGIISEDLPTSGSPVTVAVGLYQIVYGAITLFWARGDQISLYGYASFSLAVIPYIIMTIVNLIAQLLTDDYPVVYMVETDIMREAMDPKRGGSFHAVSYTHLTLPTKRIV